MTQPKHPSKTTDKKKSSKKSSASAPNSSKGALWTFPKNTLEDAIRIAKAIEDKYAGNPIKAEVLAPAVGFNQPADPRFRDLLKSANQYGLVSGSGTKATISLEDIGRNITTPSTPQVRKEALAAAFNHVEDFKKVEDYYKGKRIPEDEYFLNTVTRECSIPRDRAETFAEIFAANRKFLQSFAVSPSTGTLPSAAASGEHIAGDDQVAPSPSDHGPVRTREFLDTCFVMMPFGKWYDQYYKEIYVPAIKDAGFEPVRADELFSTGSVMEQIWEEISKAKLLLADLTNKNPNVFYELGLAHAARKPVVFTSGNLEDIPFDLRHLRVITYEVRDPQWGEKLKRMTTDYLRNAAKDPTKSIPHPFRVNEGADETA